MNKTRVFKELDMPTKKGLKYEEINVRRFIELIYNGKKHFEGYWIKGKGEKYNLIENEIIRDITFDDCMFHGVRALGNTIINCSFIDCDFSWCYIHRNRVIDSYSDSILIEDFSNVQFNTFDNLKGNMDHLTGFNTFNKNNVFRNMNMDGFTGIFFEDAFAGGALRWCNNFFYNTTISIDAIAKLSEEAKYIWNGAGDWDLSEERTIVEENEDDEYAWNRGGFVTSWNGADEFIIDIENMSKVGKINLVANLFTKFCRGSMFVINKDYEISPESTIEFYTVPNPFPIKIVSSDGNTVDISKMKDIDIHIPFKPNYEAICWKKFLSYDGRELEYLYKGDSDITNQKKYLCAQFVKKQ